MPKLDIDGTRVEFPFTPYDCQLTYIRGVLEALNGSVRTPPSDLTFFRFFKYFNFATYDREKLDARGIGWYMRRCPPQTIDTLRAYGLLVNDAALSLSTTIVVANHAM